MTAKAQAGVIVRRFWALNASDAQDERETAWRRQFDSSSSLGFTLMAWKCVCVCLDEWFALYVCTCVCTCTCDNIHFYLRLFIFCLVPALHVTCTGNKIPRKTSKAAWTSFLLEETQTCFDQTRRSFPDAAWEKWARIPLPWGANCLAWKYTAMRFSVSNVV